MKIGLLGGSFDPPHIGHLIIANYLVEFTDIDLVWLSVSPHNPLKSSDHLSDEHIRYQMVDRATHHHPNIEACNFEFSLDRPSYTYDTLKALSKSYPEHEFVLLLGADNIHVFDQWKNHEQILEQYSIYVYPREGQTTILQHPHLHYINAPRVDISSTRLRKWLKDKKNIYYYLPQGVQEIIEEHQLYL